MSHQAMEPYRIELSDRESNIMYDDRMTELDSKVLETCVATREEQDPDKRIRAVFDLFDVDKQQKLTPAGLQAFLASTMAHSNVTLCGIELQDIVNQAFDAANQQHSLTFDEFKQLFGNSLETRRTDMQRSSRLHSSKASTPSSTSTDRFCAFLLRYQSEVQFLALYAFINALAFWLKWRSFPADIVAGQLGKLAKSCAQLVLVNAMFVLLPMCRSVVIALRNIRVLWYIFPFDHHIVFHQLAGMLILVSGTVHTIAWLLICIRAKNASDSQWERSMLNTHKIKLLRYAEVMEIAAALPIWTGIAMLICAAIALPCTLHCVRRRNFNLFWFTHFLFFPFLVFLFIHGAASWIAPPQAWFWVAGPMVIYVVERRYRVTSVFGGQTRLNHAHVMSDAVVLYLKKPRGFKDFRPGMYLYLQVPELSRFEWHPFTISSAPQDEHLSLHIRAAGDWTSALHTRLKCDNEILPAIAIDGPVGAPSIEYANYSTVILIGGGIGVTPFASILRHMLHVWEEHRCPSCGQVQLPASRKLQRVYFYWITKEQNHMSWFRDMLNQLSELDTDRRLTINTYLTNLNSRSTAAAPLKLIQTFMQERQNRDIFTGLHGSKMHMGRPYWAHELQSIARENRSATDIGVFLCGPPALDRDVQAKCNDFNSNNFHGLQFSYHSEKF